MGANSIGVNESRDQNAIPVATNRVGELHYPIYNMGYGPKGEAPTYVAPSAPLPVGFTAKSANVDAFGRLRVSSVETVFDSKQIHNNQALYWDDQQVSGGGTNSVWNKATASSILSVSASTAGKRIRQTFMRHNYQSGKSQLIFMTGTLSVSGGSTGITRAMGAFDDDNGIFVRDNQGVVQFVIRSSASGSAVDNPINQENWNLDKMDGTGPSGITLNTASSQILVMDYEWLGVGRVRIGFVIGGEILYCHEFLHSNVVAGVYMSTPNLPLRYEIENDGTGVASSLEHICTAVMSEGGTQRAGTDHSEATEHLFIEASVAATKYAVFGIRLKADNLDASIEIIQAMMMNSANDNYHWEIINDPVMAGSVTWIDDADSAVQYALGDVINDPSTTTITGGHTIASGYVKSGAATGSLSEQIKTQLKLGSFIDGTPTEQWLSVTPLTAGSNIYGGISWREIS